MKGEAPEGSFYLRGLRAGIAARTVSKPEAGSVAALAGEATRPEFHLASKLAECAAEDRAPDATERRLLSQRGFLYLGPEKDGFLVQAVVLEQRIDAHQLLGLAAMCQQFANGSVEFDEQGNASLQVVSVCDAPEVLRQMEASGLKVAGESTEFSASRRRLLSSEMVSLAERMEAGGRFTFREIIWPSRFIAQG